MPFLAVLRFSRNEATGPKKWAADLLVSKPHNVVTVAFINKDVLTNPLKCMGSALRNSLEPAAFSGRIQRPDTCLHPTKSLPHRETLPSGDPPSMNPKRGAGLRPVERQIAEFIKDDEVQTCDVISHSALPGFMFIGDAVGQSLVYARRAQSKKQDALSK